MPDDSTRTILVAIGADIGVALAKVGTAVFTGSSAVAAGAAEALADTANDVFLLIAQRRGSRPPDDQHPLGYGREAYFWSLIAALGVFVTNDRRVPRVRRVVPGRSRQAGCGHDRGDQAQAAADPGGGVPGSGHDGA